MLRDPLDIILEIKSESDLNSLKRRVREVALAYGCDRSVLFSVRPVNEGLWNVYSGLKETGLKTILMQRPIWNVAL